MKQKQADKPRVEVTRAARPMTINNYAWKSLRGNKSVIIMIALAAMLITAILNLGYSTQQSILEETLAVVGDNQVRFANITDEQEALLSGRREIALFDL
ncbi:MAG: hypothetical protein FWH40_07755, partial [Coriobacteriia bacterium]|nr:hypothetical protein [Coriobacteriia bacterium]